MENHDSTTPFCRVRTCQYPATLRLTVCVETTHHVEEIGEASYVTERRENWLVCTHHRGIAGSRIRGSQRLGGQLVPFTVPR
jgi:hypothetical protein